MSLRFQSQERWSFTFQDSYAGTTCLEKVSRSVTSYIHLGPVFGLPPDSIRRPSWFLPDRPEQLRTFRVRKIWERLNRVLTKATRKVTGLLLYLSCFVNPLLYTCFGSSMRKKLGRIMRRSFSQESLENTIFWPHIFKFVPQSLTQHLRTLAPRGQLPP